MRYWVGGVAAFLAALVQASSVEQFHALGVSPNLMLVLLVAWLAVRGLDDVLPMVGVAGVTMAFIGLQTPGATLIALLLPIVLLGAVRELHLVHSEMLLALCMVLAGTFIYESVLLGGAMLTGGVVEPGPGMTEAVMPAVIVNALLGLPVYLIMRLARPAPRGSAYSL